MPHKSRHLQRGESVPFTQQGLNLVKELLSRGRQVQMLADHSIGFQGLLANGRECNFLGELLPITLTNQLL